jgi:hypothetical protein
VRVIETSSQALADEAERLVALASGDGVGVGLVPVEEALLVAAQPEEVVLLLQPGSTGPVWIGQLPSTRSASA